MSRVKLLVVTLAVAIGAAIVMPVRAQDLNTQLAYFIANMRAGIFPVGDGSISAPAFTFSSNTDTGLYMTSGLIAWSQDNSLIAYSSSGTPRNFVVSKGFALESHGTITVDGASTFALTGAFNVLACTGAESISTITGGMTGSLLYLEDTDTDCTLVDDDAPTASNALNLTGTGNDVGAAGKLVVLIYDGTAWLEVTESANN